MDDGKKDLQVSAHREHLADGNRYKKTTVLEKERVVDEKSGAPYSSFWARCHDRWALVSFLVSSMIYLTLSIHCLYCMVADYSNLSDINVPDTWTVSTSKIKREYAYNIVPTPSRADKVLLVWSETAICVVVIVIVVGSLFLLKSRYRLARDILDTANKAAKAHWSVFWTVLIGGHMGKSDLGLLSSKALRY
ncbi:hypothetical protein I305_05882 [Cryptococcus gattii E566]|uniref:Uncharacterized protein n=2 Tax=Cryptococcus gattii TaxID=37769 RepID=E6REN9_CRYGW|nr:Hypothetical Protein CGB_L1130C [Cryptococcus gattii WM276]ADV25225.1 Hypothetical Protein CGB_L1130C [Cryptococcus gattii WM276]KIR76700.1 hypothetical protein I306_06320 [Cryptococcus gattii EJB2]KIY31641.1 hypothetical protein I305_05882 [Cryptococcus gattii E566]